jgi:regulator of protease activity HflC (stomatin/prohibitin superfamily)
MSGKQIFSIAALIVVILALTILYFNITERVPVGYVGVKVKSLGSDRGINKDALDVGLWVVGMNTTVYKYPVFIETYPFTASATEGSPENEQFTFQDNSGMAFTCDLSVTARTSKELAPTLYSKYREDLSTVIKKYIRNDIRDALNRQSSYYTSEELIGAKKAALLDSVNVIVKREALLKGIIIEHISLTEIRPPAVIVAAIEAKSAATQNAMKVENMEREAKANANIKVVAAEADAKANAIMSQSITPALVRWYEIQNTKLFIEAWAKGGSNVPGTLVGGDSKFNMLFNTGK